MNTGTLIIILLAVGVALYLYSQSNAAGSASPITGGIGGNPSSSVYPTGNANPITSARSASHSQLLQNQLGNLNGQGSANVPSDGMQQTTSPNASPGPGYSPSGSSPSIMTGLTGADFTSSVS